MRGKPVKLPPCGMFIGSGIYAMSKDYLLSSLYAHLSWGQQYDAPLAMLDKIIKDNQGNLAQFWGRVRGNSPKTVAEWLYALNEIGIDVPDPDWAAGKGLRAEENRELQEHADRRGAGAVRFMKAAAARDIYTTLLYIDMEQQWVDRFGDVGDYYIGYDYGEDFAFRLDNAVADGTSMEDVDLRMLADDFMGRVGAHIEQRHAAGWGNIMATSASFYVDYEIAAGADIPLIEDFAFSHLNMASALSRGLYRQHDLPTWGSHLAHEHYSWIPYNSPYKFKLLKASMYQKYMSGSKIIINESGNWFVEANLCEDSPKFEFPRIDLPRQCLREEPQLFAPYIEEARKHYNKVDYNAPMPRRYRREISDFYDFVKANGTPEGQPETTLAVAKGNYDLCGHVFSANHAIAGAYDLADRNPAWFEGAPERGWDAVKSVFFPLLPVMGDYPNRFLSGTPYGMIDIVSFVRDMIDADFLSANYKALLFSGWNTSSPEQYAILRQYVEKGGILFISIPQLSTDTRRNCWSYTRDDLVNGGDFADLCGVRVKGPGKRFYWAVAPQGSEEMGFVFPRRFGIMSTCMGDIEITDPDMETLAVEDEAAYPLLLRRRCGLGTIYFLNSWAYPGALNVDEGPGSRVSSKGLIGEIYRHIAGLTRGHVWITDDRRSTGSECEYIAFSYFPQPGVVCLQNVDFDRPHSFFLHHFGAVDPIELAPAEFRMLETVSEDGSTLRSSTSRR